MIKGGFILIQRTSLIFAIIFPYTGCHTLPGSSVDSWIGHYLYEEEPLVPAEGSTALMTWELVVSKSADSTLGMVEVNGFQTLIKAETRLEGDSNTLNVIFEKKVEGSGAWNPGDTLFVLSRKGKLTITIWKKATPRLRENFPTTCECF